MRFPEALGLGILVVGFTLTEAGSHAAESPTLYLESSNPKLDAAFCWATAKALSYVQTGKTGPVDGHERDRQGQGSVKYIPCYWAGYTFRTAFYSRDFCHQTTGAHLLGLRQENLSMLGAFAATATAGRKWFPLWALNRSTSSSTGNGLSSVPISYWRGVPCSEPNLRRDKSWKSTISHRSKTGSWPTWPNLKMEPSVWGSL